MKHTEDEKFRLNNRRVVLCYLSKQLAGLFHINTTNQSTSRVADRIISGALNETYLFEFV